MAAMQCTSSRRHLCCSCTCDAVLNIQYSAIKYIQLLLSRICNSPQQIVGSDICTLPTVHVQAYVEYTKLITDMVLTTV